jgi:hypothetical protein
MRVAGVDIPASTVAKLALVLHRAGEDALAMRVGRAVDNQRQAVDLNRRECGDILRVLEDAPDGLTPLREALLQKGQP